MPLVPHYIEHAKTPAKFDSRTLEAQWQALRKAWERQAVVLNGGISFGDGVSSDNIAGTWISANTGPANTDFTLAHNLGRLPVGYLLMRQDQPAALYDGTIPWTTTEITLRCNTDDVNIVVFVV